MSIKRFLGWAFVENDLSSQMVAKMFWTVNTARNDESYHEYIKVQDYDYIRRLVIMVVSTSLLITPPEYRTVGCIISNIKMIIAGEVLEIFMDFEEIQMFDFCDDGNNYINFICEQLFAEFTDADLEHAVVPDKYDPECFADAVEGKPELDDAIVAIEMFFRSISQDGMTHVDDDQLLDLVISNFNEGNPDNILIIPVVWKVTKILSYDFHFPYCELAMNTKIVPHLMEVLSNPRREHSDEFIEKNIINAIMVVFANSETNISDIYE